MGDRQRLAVYDKVTPIGPAECCICDSLRADCIAFTLKIFWFSKTICLCDTCVSYIVRLFSRDKGGDA